MWKSTLTDDFDGVKRRLDRTSTYIKHYISATEYRLVLERRFAADILRSPLKASSSDATSLQDLTTETFDSLVHMNAYFISLAQRKSESIIAFCSNVEAEVLCELRGLLEEEVEVLGPLLSEGKRTVKELQNAYRVHDDAVLAFDAACRVADAAVEELATGSGLRPRLKAAEAARIASEREVAYTDAISRVNTARRQFLAEMEPVLDALESFEKKRLSRLDDIYRKMHIYEIQVLKSIEYDVNQQFDHVSVAADKQVEAFAEMQKTDFMRKRGKSPDAENFVKDTPQLTWPELQTSLRRVGDAVGDFSTADPGRSFVEEMVGEKVACESATKVGLPAEEFDDLKGRCEAVLGEALTSMDFSVALEILAVASKIYKQDQDEVTLQTELYDHNFWNLLLFWEAALSAAITETLFIFNHRERAGISEYKKFANIKLDEFRTLTEGLGLSTDTLIDITDKVLASHAEILSSQGKAAVEAALAPPKAAQPPRVAKPRSK
jgi:hypothetical protein